MKLEIAVEGLSALAHKGRLAVFRLLVKAGADGVAAGQIASGLRMPPSTLSANLSILSNAGLIAARREGRSIIYSADYDAMGGLLRYLMEDCCGGRPEVCAQVLETATLSCAPSKRR